MKSKIITLIIIVFIAGYSENMSQQDSSAVNQNPLLDSKIKKVSYAIGLDIGNNFRQQLIEYDVEAFLKGLEDGYSNTEGLLSGEELQIIMQQFQKEQKVKLMMKDEQLKSKNTEEGKAFLESNKSNPGVTTTSSGVQYKVLKSGDGATPKSTDKVSVHYSGRLIDGTEFDSSVKRGQPISIPVVNAIKGWGEVLQLMKVGDKWEIYIPSHLAYGDQAKGPIGPASVLIFEMELLGIE
ncbi:MAG: FKBP-type peptidyl-prolyl cis-trans isomerase [Bacteroidetes bacterium]|nr:FKBP-type peptidyl-prolyl cis-trans isomerase [Bacteroidota bacterium]MBU2506232.1 FKBP-type peptidyl-prolyl cis-trans isomerase [Bacteroidota bacterium]